MDKASDLPTITEERNLLYDFYGPMLTKKQAACFTMRYVEDYSLSEIAQELEISPQAVVDFLKRALGRLVQAEGQLGLIKKFQHQQALMIDIATKLDELEREIGPAEQLKWIKQAIGELII